jgi:glycosyltransferase involved in cell wall biosynthesis
VVWLLRISQGAPVMVMGDNTPLSFTYCPKPSSRIALLRWLLRHTQAVFFIGQRNRDFWFELGVPAKPLFYTPHSVDNARFAEAAERLLPQRWSLCCQYGLDPDRHVFLFCGKLISIKRPVHLLDSFIAAGLHE